MRRFRRCAINAVLVDNVWGCLREGRRPGRGQRTERCAACQKVACPPLHLLLPSAAERERPAQYAAKSAGDAAGWQTATRAAAEVEDAAERAAEFKAAASTAA